MPYRFWRVIRTDHLQTHPHAYVETGLNFLQWYGFDLGFLCRARLTCHDKAGFVQRISCQRRLDLVQLIARHSHKAAQNNLRHDASRPIQNPAISRLFQ